MCGDARIGYKGHQSAKGGGNRWRMAEFGNRGNILVHAGESTGRAWERISIFFFVDSDYGRLRAVLCGGVEIWIFGDPILEVRPIQKDREPQSPKVKLLPCPWHGGS
jgi:hypothetical protein